MRTIALAAALALSFGPAPRADEGPDYGAFVVGTFLSFLGGPAQDGRIDAVPRLDVSFGAGPAHPAQMDTGSTGLVVSADQVPNLDGRLCDGCLTYSSSGRILSGVWVTIAATITGDNGQSITTTPIPVLAVTAITCTAHARNCQAEDHPSNVDLIGVGFAREHDHQPDGTPDANPFLNVQAPTDAAARRGYVVAKTGVHVGLTRKNTQGDFHFVKLAPDAHIPGEWQAAPACISVAQGPPACGSVLVDTGVTSMFLTVPPQAVAGLLDDHGALADKTRIDVVLPESRGEAAASYGFAAGPGSDPLAPATIHLNTTRPLPFVNTGVRFLNGFDVLYDADGGFLAYRARPPAP